MYLLEQSEPWRPALHVHCPVEVLQSPALLQSPGHVNSVKRCMSCNYTANRYNGC